MKRIGTGVRKKRDATCADRFGKLPDEGQKDRPSFFVVCPFAPTNGNLVSKKMLAKMPHEERRQTLPDEGRQTDINWHLGQQKNVGQDAT